MHIILCLFIQLLKNTGLLSSFGYCVKCCYGYECKNNYLSPCLQTFWLYTRSGITGSHGKSILKLLKTHHIVFPQWLHHFIFPAAYTGISVSPHLCQHLLLCFIDNSHSNGYEIISHGSLAFFV